MSQQLSAHLQNAGILVIAAIVALAADRLAGAGSRTRVAVPGSASIATLGRYLTPIASESIGVPNRVLVGLDPFAETTSPAFAAKPGGRSAELPATPRLTAILLADNRRVAIIDDATVSVGDVLRDGARVSAIQSDRVWLMQRNGQWRVLSLLPQGQ